MSHSFWVIYKGKANSPLSSSKLCSRLFPPRHHEDVHDERSVLCLRTHHSKIQSSTLEGFGGFQTFSRSKNVPRVLSHCCKLTPHSPQYDPPSYFQGLSPPALWFIRQIITGLALILALEMAFLTGSIGLCLLLGPKVLGLRGYAWQYPTNWGSYTNILNKGLNGFWGSVWHQTFRFAFGAPTNYLIRNKYIEPPSTAAKVLGLFFAFGISGFLHLAGSISQLPQ